MKRFVGKIDGECQSFNAKIINIWSVIGLKVGFINTGSDLKWHNQVYLQHNDQYSNGWLSLWASYRIKGCWIGTVIKHG